MPAPASVPFRLRELEGRIPLRMRIARGDTQPAVSTNEVVFWEETSAAVVKILVRLTGGVNTYTLQSPSATEVVNDSAVTGDDVAAALEYLYLTTSDADKHREINDSGSSTTDLFSASKILSLLFDATIASGTSLPGVPTNAGDIYILDRSGSSDGFVGYIGGPNSSGTLVWAEFVNIGGRG